MFGFLFSVMFSVILWPVAFLWNALRDAVSALVTMGHDPRVGLLSLGWVLLKLAGTAGLVVSVVWAFTVEGSSLTAFLMSCVRHGVVWLAVGSVVALGVSALLLDLADDRCGEVDYRQDVRMRRRVEREEAECQGSR